MEEVASPEELKRYARFLEFCVKKLQDIDFCVENLWKLNGIEGQEMDWDYEGMKFNFAFHRFRGFNGSVANFFYNTNGETGSYIHSKLLSLYDKENDCVELRNRKYCLKFFRCMEIDFRSFEMRAYMIQHDLDKRMKIHYDKTANGTPLMEQFNIMEEDLKDALIAYTKICYTEKGY